MAVERPELWVNPERVSARKLNQPVEAIRRIMTVMGWDTSSDRTPDRIRFPSFCRVGRVVSAGPSSEADYTDERYWVREAIIEDGTSNADIVVLRDVPDFTVTDPRDSTGATSATIKPIFTVTNLGELTAHSHTLGVGEPVLFFGFQDGADPTPNKRYLMVVGGGSESAPEFDGDVHRGVANGVAGWAPPSITNYTP